MTHLLSPTVSGFFLAKIIKIKRLTPFKNGSPRLKKGRLKVTEALPNIWQGVFEWGELWYTRKVDKKM